MRIDMELIKNLLKRRLFVTLPIMLVAIAFFLAISQPTRIITTPTHSSNPKVTTLQQVNEPSDKVLDDQTSSPNTSQTDESDTTDAANGSSSASQQSTPPPTDTTTPSQPQTTPTYTCTCVYRGTESVDSTACLDYSLTCPAPQPGPCGTCGGGGFRHPGTMCAMYCVE